MWANCVGQTNTYICMYVCMGSSNKVKYIIHILIFFTFTTFCHDSLLHDLPSGLEKVLKKVQPKVILCRQCDCLCLFLFFLFHCFRDLVFLLRWVGIFITNINGKSVPSILWVGQGQVFTVESSTKYRVLIVT